MNAFSRYSKYSIPFLVLAALLVLFQNCGSSFSSQLAAMSVNSQLNLPSTSSTPLASPTAGPTAGPEQTPTPQPTSTPSPSPVPTAIPNAALKIALHQADVGNGLMRYTATVKIGNAPAFEAIIDTGSVGLRVMPGVLSASDYEDTGVTTKETLGGTRILQGTVALAVVNIGGNLTPKKIPISVVTSATCAASAPNCNPGLPGGIVGLLGIGLRANDTPNPLIELGARQWILAGGQPGASGAITYYTAPIDSTGYFTLQIPAETSVKSGLQPLWNDKALSSCVINNDDGTSTCGPTILDTGGNANFHLSAGGGGSVWADGTHVTFRLTNAAGANYNSNFVIGTKPGMDVTLPTTSTTSTLTNPINSGQYIFFQSAVLYDPVKGTIGVKHVD